MKSPTPFSITTCGFWSDFRKRPANPHEGIGVWVSGFFGSGKSSFAKILGLALSNRDILGKGAADRFIERRADSAKTPSRDEADHRENTH